MPLIILVINLRLNEAIVDQNRSEVDLGVGVIECAAPLLDLRKELLPFANVVSELLINALLVDCPEGLVAQPC